jgi:hypothetical protein
MLLQMFLEANFVKDVATRCTHQKAIVKPDLMLDEIFFL